MFFITTIYIYINLKTITLDVINQPCGLVLPHRIPWVGWDGSAMDPLRQGEEEKVLRCLSHRPCLFFPSEWEEIAKKNNLWFLVVDGTYGGLKMFYSCVFL